MERDVADAVALELRDERTRRADPDGFAAGVAHRAELGEQEEPQAHVGGREVRDLHGLPRLPRSTVR